MDSIDILCLAPAHFGSPLREYYNQEISQIACWFKGVPRDSLESFLLLFPMSTGTKDIILAESSRFIGQIANNIVLHLQTRIREIEAIARSLARTVETLPQDPALLLKVLPPLLDFNGDGDIAGGGYWAEPGQFVVGQERCSFFWNRDVAGTLVFYDDYNQAPEGYHQEPWYVVGYHLQPGQCFWSASYIDPYSLQPMITCTTPTFAAGRLSGVVTIDLKLAGLHAEIEKWRSQTGGYIFIVDYLNKFVTFPEPERVLKVTQERGRVLKEFMLATEFVPQEPGFLPIASALAHWNQDFLQCQQQTAASTAIATQLQQQAGLSAAEAQLIGCILQDSRRSPIGPSFLQQEFEINDDFLTQEAATVSLFHVPRAYFKLVVVKPFSEAATTTYSLIQAEKMSSMGKFVAGMAHEINNPVNYVYGNIEYADLYFRDLLALVNRYQQELPHPSLALQQFLAAIDFEFLVEDLPKVMHSIKIGADRIRQLVASLRNFARIDEAGLKLVNLYEGIDNTLELLTSRLRSKPEQAGINIIKNYDDLPPIECHAGLINQVFMNLLINAIDALETVDHRNKIITITGKQINAEWIQLAIADNGPGIPAAIRQRLFDPFFTTKPIGKGTGLGLSVSYQIVTEKHGGKLTCHSILGQGSHFVMELPIHQPHLR